MPAGSTPPLPTDVGVVRGDAPTDGGWEHPPTPPTARWWHTEHSKAGMSDDFRVTVLAVSRPFVLC